MPSKRYTLSRRRELILFLLKRFLPILSSLAALLVHLFVSNSPKFFDKPLPYFTNILFTATAAFAVCIAVSFFKKDFGEKYTHKAPFYAAAILFLNIYNIATLKLMLIPSIYFPCPDKILNVFVKERMFLLTCLAHSARLLFSGFGLGLICGLTTGILVGWSKRWSYWITPLIKIIGPIPSTAWIPIALVCFSTSRQASIFLIALAVWFPTTVLTSSGISNVKNAYFEVASTLGANTFQKIFKIALPDAMPSIFIGVFNGTCASFLTLMTAEMLGVKFGIGWYINWQREVLAYANVYAGLITIAVSFSLIITALFKVRDRLLGWQKGVIKW
jgi:NitT/TauT family transport system permease protein